MKHIRTIIQTKLRMPEASIRQIARISNCSRPTAQEYLDRLALHPLSLEELKSFNDEQLSTHLANESSPPIQDTEDNTCLGTWLDTHINQLAKPGMTRRLLHEEYLVEHPQGLQYSQFCFILQQRTQDPEASGMFDHKAGDKLYLDFTGRKFDWKDEGGNEHVEEVFLAVMGASSRFFAKPVPNQKQETFAAATQDAFRYFGGVPHAVVPDCLKSAVLHHDGYEPVHNPLFQRLLDHYGVVSIPARPRRPKDKPVVESTVNIVYRRIMVKLAGKTFADREALLMAWNRELEITNAAPFQRLPGNRTSRFEAIDRPALRALPDQEFSLTTILRQTVQTTLAVYVSEDKTSYSVPHTLKGKEVEVLVNPGSIEIWHGHQRYATHPRSPEAGKVINAEHLGIAQAWYAKRNPEESVRTLQGQGIHVGRWASHIFETAPHADIAWRILDGLISLTRKYPDRIDRVCRRALAQELFTLKDLRGLFKSGEDQGEVAAEALTAELPFHENVRGSAYYGQAVPQ